MPRPCQALSIASRASRQMGIGKCRGAGAYGPRGGRMLDLPGDECVVADDVESMIGDDERAGDVAALGLAGV
jgi:hypothetical protein